MIKENINSIKVVIRIRPINKIDYKQIKGKRSSGPEVCLSLKSDGQTIELIKDPYSSRIFRFNYVFSENITQYNVYKYSCSDIINSFLNGYHSSIICYGQTGTGKTYTMFGKMDQWNYNSNYYINNDNNDNQLGMLQQSLNDIFQYIYNCQQNGKYIRLYLSFYEIYLENISDLLLPITHNTQNNSNSNSNNKNNKNKLNSLNIRESVEKGVYVEGLSVFSVTNPDDIYKLIQTAVSNRVTFSLEMNETSSRSHAILQLTLEQEIDSIESVQSLDSISNSTKIINENKKILKNVLTFCDLAGSERVHRVGTNGLRLREAQNINRSICALGNCIQSLAILSIQKNQKNNGNNNNTNSNNINSVHIPYRDSKLTRLLSETLSGNSRTCIISTIGPCHHSYEETLSTLIFSTRAAAIRKTVKQVKPIAGIFSDLSETIQNWKWPPPKNISLHENITEKDDNDNNNDDNDNDNDDNNFNQEEEFLPPLPPPPSPPPLISSSSTTTTSKSKSNTLLNNRPLTPNFLQDGKQVSPIPQSNLSTKNSNSDKNNNNEKYLLDDTSYLYPISPEEISTIEIKKSPNISTNFTQPFSTSSTNSASTPTRLSMLQTSSSIPQRRHSFSDSRRKIKLHPTIVMKRLSEETPSRVKSPISERLSNELNQTDSVNEKNNIELFNRLDNEGNLSTSKVKQPSLVSNKSLEEINPSLEMLASEDLNFHYLEDSNFLSVGKNKKNNIKSNLDQQYHEFDDTSTVHSLDTNSETVSILKSSKSNQKVSSKSSFKTTNNKSNPITPLNKHYEKLQVNQMGIDDLANTLEKELNKFRLDHNLHEVSPYELINDNKEDFHYNKEYSNNINDDNSSQISQSNGINQSIRSNNKMKSFYQTPETPESISTSTSTSFASSSISSLKNNQLHQITPKSNIKYSQSAQIIPSPVRITISRDLVKLSHVPPPPSTPPPLLSIQPSLESGKSSPTQSIKSINIEPLPPLKIDQSTSVDITYSDKSTNTPLATPINNNPCPNCTIAKGEIILLKHEICGYTEEINYLKELLQPNLPPYTMKYIKKSRE